LAEFGVFMYFSGGSIFFHSVSYLQIRQNFVEKTKARNFAAHIIVAGTRQVWFKCETRARVSAKSWEKLDSDIGVFGGGSCCL